MYFIIPERYTRFIKIEHEQKLSVKINKINDLKDKLSSNELVFDRNRCIITN